MENPIDTTPSIVLSKPDAEAINRARRWLRGAAALLAAASNGDPTIEKIAAEASTLAVVTEIVLHDVLTTV